MREGKGSKRPRYKRTRSGSPFTHSFDYLAKKLIDQKVLDETCRKNLEALAELRDTAVHFYHRSPEIAERVQEIGIAAVKNFAAAAQDWFNEDLSRFNFYLMSLSFVTPPPFAEVVELNKEEKRFLGYIRKLEGDASDPNARYAVAINVEIRFVRSKSATATPVRVTSDPTAPAVRLTDEQILEHHPWDYQELTNQCRERYSDFKVEQKYHQLRKGLEADIRLAHERRLDPPKPHPKKMFYAPAILDEFDKHYQRRH